MSTSHHWYKTVTLCSQATAPLAQQYQHSGIKLASEPTQKAMQTFSREMETVSRGLETVSRSLFPPGVRFHPTDEELIVYYLENKVNSRALPTRLIGEIQLYNYDPWNLPNRARYGEDEWYFFTPRDRKYPNGVRPNRAAGSGFWKATGTDKPILNSLGTRIGVKKALVFYSGNAPNAVKTNWIMIEYRLLDTVRQPSRSEGSMRLDDWVLCRIKQKGNMSNNAYHEVQPTSSNLVEYLPRIMELPSVPTGGHSTNICAGYFLPKECNLLATLLADQDLPRAVENIPGTSESSNISKNLDADYENMPDNAILMPNSSIFQDFFNSSGEKAKNVAGTSQSSNISKNFDAAYENVPDNVILAPNSSISQNFFNSSNKKAKNVPGTSQSSSISKNFDADYEHMPDNAILTLNSSIFQDFFNSSEEKVMQEANTLYESIHQPTGWITAETRDKDFIISNEQPTTSAASFYDQYQSQGDIINFLP